MLMPKSTFQALLLGLHPLFLAVALVGLTAGVEEPFPPLTFISDTTTSPAISPVPRSLPVGAIVVRSAGTVLEDNDACCPIIDQFTL